MRCLGAIAVGLVLAACGPIPQPFQGTNKVTSDIAALDVPSAVGIAVVPMIGLPSPASEAFTKAVAKGLEPFEIPAEAVSLNNGLGFTLQGTAVNPVRAGGRMSGDVLWRLTSKQGRDAGTYLQAIQIPVTEWEAAGGPSWEQAGRDAATAIAAMIDGRTVQAAGGAVTMAQPQATAAQRPLRISVKPVDGAPGDGQEALQLATLETLLNQGLKRDDITPEVIVMGRVQIEAAPGGQEFVTIAWRAIAQDGTDLGEVKLTNTIPKGSLDGRWGATAFAVAEAGLADLMQLLASSPRL